MFKKIVLDNGLRIVLVPQPGNLATTVLVLTETGSKYESKEISGISHFLEHLCFKGTTKRPNSIDISAELDGMGAFYNAFTGAEYTGYFAKARANHFENILDVVSDIYLNQIFDTEELEKEKGVIIEEMNLYEDIPMRKVQNLFMELLYGDQPAGWDIAGNKDVIRNLTKDDFVKYHKMHYVAKSTIVVIAGAFDEIKAVEKVKEYFSQITDQLKVVKLPTIDTQSNPTVSLIHKKTDQTHFILGVRALNVFDKRKYIIEVLSDILGGGMSSRLFQKIRNELGAAYYINAGSDLYTDHGYLAVSCGVDNNRVLEIISVVLEELKKLANEPIPEKELVRAKEHLTGNLILSLETSNRMAEFYGGQEVTSGDMATPEQIIEKINLVTAEEIMTMAKEIFQNQKLNLALIGPFEDKEPFEKILTF
ncbi:hypothetical protein COV23_01645 [Candidatus Wolfebacteria bacterium CG10_big_fil_rev_8_21_14_0_10_31_9]|uniref:Peptidase M16 n=1 Tax=Candidatus Wolfebacteria bacterium CG10_big_fil_rev_8_21_14_0_10_31_9 TaxID=1975070 RepID=A0A2H0RDJ7_9BACT|nr:MAG: hypothetical protein COV23_01645 [Candidatus Wolfebacteria bacterium CG10_big_fil_rev_8_21_14_0_10_31_9]